MLIITVIIVVLVAKDACCLSTFASDTASQLDVLRHNCDTLSMDGAQVGVFKETYQVGFTGFLQCTDGRRLETEIGLEILGNFTHQPLEGQLADQQFGGLLVPTNFSQGDRTRAVTMGLLDASGRWGAFTGGLGGQLLTGSLTSGGFTGGLLSTGHCWLEECSLELFANKLLIRTW